MKQTLENIMTAFMDLEKSYLSEISSNKPKIGYLCMRTPVEIIEAMGGVPVRIVPRPGFDTNHFSTVRPDGCSFCRMIPSILKTEYYDGLSAIIAGSCCDQMRRVMDTLLRDLDIPVILFGAPRTWGSDKDYFLGQMTGAFNILAEFLNTLITVEKVSDSIKSRNNLRKLVIELRRLKKLPTMLLHKLAASPLPPGDIINFLNKIDYSKDNNSIDILLAGSITNSWELDELEHAGANIIADVTCLGDRVFHETVVEIGDPFESLYDTYVEQNLCPHRRPMTPLIDYMRNLALEREAQGIIYLTLKYCHPWGLNAVRMKSELGLPFLHVDDDLSSPAKGNFRTRIGAFIEMLKVRKLREAI